MEALAAKLKSQPSFPPSALHFSLLKNMAGLVSGLVQNVLGMLSAKVYEEVYLACTIKSDLRKIEHTVFTIKDVLEDAEERQKQDDRLRHWLEQLNDVLYDAEDVFDEFECEALRREVVKQWSTPRKVCQFFSVNSNPFIFSFKMAHRIREINEKLDDIATISKTFHLIQREARHDFMHPTREITHSFINPSNVVGRENDKEKLIQLLLQSNENTEPPSVISLVGIGGLGKTTVAKLVYNEERINKHFTKRMWVCVSVDFDVQRLMRDILTAASDENLREEHLTMDKLQKRLRDKLDGQRFLLVLDDVWNEDANKWRELRQFLTVGAKGSKVLVTTRLNTVANIMSKNELKHELKGITKEESWSLLEKYAFGDEKEKKVPEDTKRIGEEILKKCKGVPLAIKSLGSLLYSKTSVNDWEYIRDSEIWQLEGQKEDGILPALKLSYSLMPSYLRPCFVYCALFPKDYVYSRDRLIQLWMAQGMLYSKNESEELEDRGERYFKELCSRSFFQDFSTFDYYSFDCSFKMHDLVHDLALSIAQDKYLTVESNAKIFHENAQHLYLKDFDHSTTWSRIQPLKRARSIALSKHTYTFDYLDCKCITKFKFLRVLELEAILHESLPYSIGRLKHLRYLNLGLNLKLKSLPNSICELQSLQTLILKECGKLEALPRDIGNMISLRCLILDGCWGVKALPRVVRNSISIRYLSITEKQMRQLLQGDGIECLSNLRFLAITGFPGNREFNPDVSNSELLGQMGEENNQDARNPIAIESKLQKLHLEKLSGEALPHWPRIFAKTLRRVRIVDCGNLRALPEWISELSSLEALEIKGRSKISSLPEGMKNLTSLRVLIIDIGPLYTSEPFRDMRMVAHVPVFSMTVSLLGRPLCFGPDGQQYEA